MSGRYTKSTTGGTDGGEPDDAARCRAQASPGVAPGRTTRRPVALLVKGGGPPGFVCPGPGPGVARRVAGQDHQATVRVVDEGERTQGIRLPDGVLDRVGVRGERP